MSRTIDPDLGIATVREALERTLNVDGLKMLHALFSSKPSSTRKADLVAALLVHLDGERLRKTWEMLDDLQRAAVSEAVHETSGAYDRNCFRAKYGREPGWGGRLGAWSKEKASPLRLFFYGEGRLVIPDDLLERLEMFVPEPSGATLATLDEIPKTYAGSKRSRPPNGRDSKEPGTPIIVREMERAALSDLQTALRMVDAGKVQVSDKMRRPTAGSAKALAAVLHGGDFYGEEPSKEDRWAAAPVFPIRAFAWPMLLQAGGLAVAAGTRLQLTKAGKSALVEPSANSIRALWTRWESAKLLDELSRVEAIKGQSGNGSRGLTATAPRRGAISEALEACTPGRWIDLGEFFRYIQAAGHDFEVTRSPWSLYIAEAQYGSLGYDGSHSWEILQGRYARCLLFEYAATLGMIDVAYVHPSGALDDYGELWGTDDLPFFSRYDGLLYIRLTTLGAHALGLTDDYSPAAREVRKVLAVLPTREIVVTGENFDAADVLALDAFADRASERVWRLDVTRLLVAIEGGHPVSELRDLLLSRSGEPLPANVEQFLLDVEERAGRLQDLGPARLVECADRSTATLISSDTRLKRLCLPAGERHLVVPAASEVAFRRDLRSLGYILPASAGVVVPAPRRQAAEG